MTSPEVKLLNKRIQDTAAIDDYQQRTQVGINHVEVEGVGRVGLRQPPDCFVEVDVLQAERHCAEDEHKRLECHLVL